MCYDSNVDTLITGLPGCGVMTYVAKRILEDVAAKKPCIVIDPYGDLSEKLLSSIPTDQTSNVVHIQLGDSTSPYGLNIFDAHTQEEKEETVENFLNLLYDLYDPHRLGIIGPRFDHAVRNAILTIFYDDNPNFLKLIQCLTDQEYVNALLPKIDDPILKNYWTKQIASTDDFHKSEILDYVVSKFSPFVANEKIRASIEKNNTLSINGLLLFDFKKISNSTETNKIMGALLFFLLTKTLRNNTVECSLYCDEIQLFNQEIITYWLEHAKRFKTNLTLSTSRIGKVSPGLLYELSRLQNIIAFRLVGKDKEIIEPLLGKNISLESLKKYHAYIKTLRNGDPQPIKEINTDSHHVF